MTGSIIHGTHRPQDLIPRFLDVAAELAPMQYAQILINGGIPAHAQEDDDAEWWHSADAAFLLEDLYDLLNDFAPEGTFFGAHPGDGSDFGFWEIENDT